VQEILRIINREDRSTVYYNSGPMIRRYQRQAAGRAAARRRAAAAAVKAKAADRQARLDRAEQRSRAGRARMNRKGVRTRRQRRKEGGRAVNHTTSQFISQTGYHTASAKQSRRSARVSRAKQLSIKKYGRYSQLM